MNLLLINPCWPYPYSKGEHTYNRIWPPLALANCASLLEEDGHEVTILDAHANRIEASSISPHIQGYDKIFITSSTLDKWICPNIDILPFLKTVEQIRALTEEIYILGYHGTSDPESLFRQTNPKAIISGEPEHPVREICRNEPMDKIPNLFFQIKGEMQSTQNEQKFNLDTLPAPAYHLLETKKYKYEILGKDFMLFETNRGCKYNCQFCSKIMAGNKIRYKTHDQITHELKTAIEEYQIKNGYFIDLDFLSDKKTAEFICEFLIMKNFPFRWCCQTRPDALNLEILTQMKKAGCELIHLGVESGQQKYLDLTQKNIKIEVIQEAVKLCKKVGIKTLAFYAFGFKEETAEDRQKTFAFAKKLNTDFISFHKIYPYEHGDIYLDNLNEEVEIEKFIRKKIIEYYFRFNYIKDLDLTTALRCAKLFCGRLLTLK